MTHVHVDARALVANPPAGVERTLLLPDAAPALDHLEDAGCDVVLVGDPGAVDAVCGALGGRRAAVEAEVAPDADGWFVTRDPTACAGLRPCRGLRTILVGPRVPGRTLAARPCDVEARTLVDAVLSILAAEAMPLDRAPAPVTVTAPAPVTATP